MARNQEDVLMGDVGFCRKLCRFLRIYWHGIFSIIWPLACLPIILTHDGLAYRCLYVVTIMGGFWVTEALPLPVTSAIPIVLFPLLGILDTDPTCMAYFKETNVMFLGGIMVAIAIECSNLHNRVAMLVILCIGCSPRRLHFGLTFMTMFVSMWISNTAATAMMLPIIDAVLGELEGQRGEDNFEEKPEDEEEKGPSNMTKAYFLTAAYASSLGGITTLVGTGTNLTYRGIYESRFPKSDGINFSTWMLFCLPLVLLMTLGMWILLQVIYMGMWRPKSDDYKIVKRGVENQHVTREIIRKKYNELGKITWYETIVGILFLICVCLWFFRNPGFISGWASYSTVSIKDATPSLLIVLLMFMIPSKLDFLNSFSSDPAQRPKKPSPALLTWKVMESKMPWGLIFLLGGGFAISAGSTKSGMSTLIADSLVGLKVLPPFLILFIMCVIASSLTNFSSNVALANILLPVLNEMSVALRLHPLYLTMPVAICCSYAFMLPVGTPPNAMVMGFSKMKTTDMVKPGVAISLLCLIITVAMIPTWGSVVYNLNEFPDWALTANMTTANSTLRNLPIRV